MVDWRSLLSINWKVVLMAELCVCWGSRSADPMVQGTSCTSYGTDWAWPILQVNGNLEHNWQFVCLFRRLQRGFVICRGIAPLFGFQ